MFKIVTLIATPAWEVLLPVQVAQAQSLISMMIFAWKNVLKVTFLLWVLVQVIFSYIFKLIGFFRMLISM